MSRETRRTMRAIALDQFGGPEQLKLQQIPVPDAGPDEILVRVDTAGVGKWDPFECEGGFVKMLGLEPTFPYVPGADGAGIVVAVGRRIKRFKEGDRVYGISLANPKGGFYAEYAAPKEQHMARIPGKLPTDQAGVMAADAITALRGLEDTLGLRSGESLMIFGASGGVGHLALQLAKRLGARVLAVASGNDGVALAKRLGADAVVDGRGGDVPAAVRAFAPGGFDAALFTAGGDVAEQALAAVRKGGRVAYPNGVEPEPSARPDVATKSYDGRPDPDAYERLNHLIEAGPFEVHIARTFSLEEAVNAHRALGTHYLGKLALQPA